MSIGPPALPALAPEPPLGVVGAAAPIV